MDFFLNMLVLNLLLAAMYGVLALGVYITYSILDFPDLSGPRRAASPACSTSS